MTINPIALSIRAKKLGVLIRDARLQAEQTAEACAGMIGVSPETFEAYELGMKSPSMPELEALSYSLDIPLEHFWGDHTLSESKATKAPPDLKKFVALRQRIIGAQLRKARQEAGLSLEALAEQALSSPTMLEAYELGETSIPLPDLELLTGALQRSLKDFQDRNGLVGTWAAQQRALRDFAELPPDLQAFVSKPVNRPYLELAQRLSEMSVDKLRAVAEGLLEITY